MRLCGATYLHLLIEGLVLFGLNARAGSAGQDDAPLRIYNWFEAEYVHIYAAFALHVEHFMSVVISGSAWREPEEPAVRTTRACGAELNTVDTAAGGLRVWRALSPM